MLHVRGAPFTLNCLLYDLFQMDIVDGCGLAVRCYFPSLFPHFSLLDGRLSGLTWPRAKKPKLLGTFHSSSENPQVRTCVRFFFLDASSMHLRTS